MTSIKNSSPGAPAKITRPVLPEVYLRTRLFRELDAAIKRPIVWISAPAGAGKTTLVASYLEDRKIYSLWYRMDAGDNDAASFFYYMGVAAKAVAPRHHSPLPLFTPEYQGALATFTANYFRSLFERLAHPSVIVLDNFQDANADARMQEILANGFEQIPAGINVIAISREPPPPTLARAVASRAVASIGWESLKLADTETAAILRLRTAQDRRPLPASIQDLQAWTQGWVAGLILLSEQAGPAADAGMRLQGAATQAVFDYFATQVFDSADAEIQNFLLQTAFLRTISISLAASLTGTPRAGAILDHLSRRNLFTIRQSDGSFEYHPLFRSFLAGRVWTLYGEGRARALKQRSAALYVEEGDVESAVTLLQEAADWETAVPLILQSAPIMAKQGRTQTLETWLKNVPAEMCERYPWMLYWLGVCRLALDPAEARRHFERAFAIFERQADASPLYIVWSGIIESFVFEYRDLKAMDTWLDRYPNLSNNRTPPTAEAESGSVFAYILGMQQRHLGDPNLYKYVERAERILKREPDGIARFAAAAPLLRYYVMMGDDGKLGAWLDDFTECGATPKTMPFIRLQWLVWKALHDGARGEFDAAHRSVEEGLALAQETGIRAFDSFLLVHGAWAQYCAGNISAGRALVLKLQAYVGRSPLVDGQCEKFRSMMFLIDGNLTRAVSDARSAAERARTIGSLFAEVQSLTVLAYALAKSGDAEEALRHVAEVKDIARSTRSKTFEFLGEFAACYVHYLRDDRDALLPALRHALGLAREMNLLIPAYWTRSDVSRLCAIALEADIESGLIRAMISKVGIKAPPGFVSDRWPWPIRIYAFGRFVVVRDDKPISFRGKAQKRPLELLRALIAFGGIDVAVTKIVQALWPNSEGDMGRTAFRSALRRLRRLIGEQAIFFSDGQLSLNRDICWLDVWAFEQAVETPSTPSRERAKALLDLYRGEFNDEDDVLWSLTRRELLRAVFVAAISECGELLEQEEDWQAAAMAYESGISRAPYSEALYCRLMNAYQRLNRLPDAVATYQRCRRLLNDALSIEPSATTQALYRSIENDMASVHRAQPSRTQRSAVQ